MRSVESRMIAQGNGSGGGLECPKLEFDERCSGHGHYLNERRNMYRVVIFTDCQMLKALFAMPLSGHIDDSSLDMGVLESVASPGASKGQGSTLA